MNMSSLIGNDQKRTGRTSARRHVFLVGSRLRWLPFNATWRNHYRLSVY